MTTEFEAKFYPVDKTAIRTLLADKGAKLIQAETKTTIVAFGRESNPQIDGNYLRVRDEGDVVRMSIKVHAVEGGKLSDQKEIDTIVGSLEDTVAILKRTGLVQSGYQEKMRETWELQGAEVVIDTWPALETYVEIEAASEDEVKQTAELLGFSWNDKIITSVVEIYMKKYGMPVEDILAAMSNLTFTNNPFDTMQSASSAE